MSRMQHLAEGDNLLLQKEMSLKPADTRNDLSELFAENFGANASYVETLFARFRSDPALVDESWRAYFSGVLSDSSISRSDSGAITSKTADDGTASTAQGDGNKAAAAPARAPAPAAEPKAPPEETVGATPIRGPALKIVQNMEASLAVPTATSQRRIPVKLLDENRRIVNRYLSDNGGRKASYTHMIAWAVVRALAEFPQLNDGFDLIDGNPSRLKREAVNLGIAIDLEKKDGTRSLLVPNIKNANALNFSSFLDAYDDVVKRARAGKLQIADFQGTTISLTNPGTIGTVASTPRLMAGQSVIIATGAIEYPAEYQAMAAEALSQLGISKAMTISSTYDHRIIQGAESGAFLARVHELLIGEQDFYDDIFADLEIAYPPMRWATDNNPALLGG